MRLLEALLQGINKAVDSLKEIISNERMFTEVCDDLGFSIEEVPAAWSELVLPSITSFQVQLSQTINNGVSFDSIQLIKGLFQIIDGIKSSTDLSPFTDVATRTEFLQTLAKELLEYLLAQVVSEVSNSVFEFLLKLGVIERRYFRTNGLRGSGGWYGLNLKNLQWAISDPDYLVSILLNFGEGNRSNIAALVNHFLPFSYSEYDAKDDAAASLPDIHAESATGIFLTLFYVTAPDDSITPVRLRIISGLKNLPFSQDTDEDLPKAIYLLFDSPDLLPNAIELAPNLSLQTNAQSALTLIVEFYKGDVKVISPTFTASSFNFPVGLKFTQPQGHVLIGSAAGTNLNFKSTSLKAALIRSGAKWDLKAELNFESLALNLLPGGDGFLGKLLGEKAEVKIPLSIAWSANSGISIFSPSGLGFELKPNLRLGPLNILTLSFGHKSSTSKSEFYITSDFTIELGNLQLLVEKIGLSARIIDAPYGDGLLGKSDLKLGFQPPMGVGLSIDAPAISGKGYLFFDPANHKYAGIASLKIQETINVTAYGLLNTQLPGGRPGFSFLLSITARFSPAIQLGLGFTLSGLGGIVGINRTANLDVLRDGVKTGLIDRILFPNIAIQDFLPFLNQVDQAFPVDENRHVFGLMAELNWGTPTIISLRVGIIIIVPDPIDFVVLGTLTIAQPGKSDSNDTSKAILILKAVFIGIFQTGDKFISFDATLRDSRILNYSLSGDIIARVQLAKGATKPDFVYSAGGFHPLYKPSQALKIPSTMERITLRISDTNNFRLIFRSYFAVTPNTLQFGSRVDLKAGVGSGFYVEGFASFDTFIEFDPFSIRANLAAELAVKSGSRELMSLRMDGSLTGPRPWEVKGRVSFRVWFVRIDAHIDHRFGPAPETAPELPAYISPDPFIKRVRDLVSDPANYTIINSVTNRQLVSFASKTTAILPDGIISFNQAIYPLEVPIYKLGLDQVFREPIKLEIATWSFKGIGNAVGPGGRISNSSYFVSQMYGKSDDSASLAKREAYEALPSGNQLTLAGYKEYRTGTMVIADMRFDPAFYLADGSKLVTPPDPVVPSSDAITAFLRSSSGEDNPWSSQNNQAQLVGPQQISLGQRYFVADPMSLAVVPELAQGFDNYLEAEAALASFMQPGLSSKLKVYSEFELAN